MFKSDRILALDIGASKLVIAEFLVAKPHSLELLNYGIGELDIQPEADGDSSAFIVSTIRDLMRECGIKPAPMLMTVSGQSVFPRFVKLPPVTRDKIDQIVQYEAEQNVPFPINEVVWDYQLIGGEEGDLNIMLVAVKIENVKTLTDCVLAAELEPEIVDVAPMAVYNAVRYNYPDLKGCTMILDIGARSSNLIFLEGTRIFSRSIPVAGNAITQELVKEFDLSFQEAEELKLSHAFVAFGGVYAGPDSEVADQVSKVVRNVITRMHAEVNRSINFYRSQQGGSRPSLVLLTGGSSVIPHLDTFFKEKLRVDVEYLNPFINVAVNERIDAKEIGNHLHLLSEVVGLALRRALTCPIEINLMPPDIVAKKTFRRRLPFFALTATGVVLTMLCWWGYCQRMRTMRKSQLHKLEQRIGELSVINNRLGKFTIIEGKAADDVNVLLDIIAQRTQWSETLASIHSCMFDGMWLTCLHPVMKGDDQTIITHVRISGAGFKDKLEPSVIQEFEDKLKNTKRFSDDTKISRMPSLEPGAYMWEFTIEAGLTIPVRMW